jgi:hypothetical protein
MRVATNPVERILKVRSEIVHGISRNARSHLRVHLLGRDLISSLQRNNPSSGTRERLRAPFSLAGSSRLSEQPWSDVPLKNAYRHAPDIAILNYRITAAPHFLQLTNYLLSFLVVKLLLPETAYIIL